MFETPSFRRRVGQVKLFRKVANSMMQFLQFIIRFPVEGAPFLDDRRTRSTPYSRPCLLSTSIGNVVKASYRE